MNSRLLSVAEFRSFNSFVMLLKYDVTYIWDINIDSLQSILNGISINYLGQQVL
jgi:hypothetical protein